MKNIFICLNIDSKSFEKLSRIEQYVQMDNTRVTLVHTWNRDAYAYPGEMIVAFYPNESQANDIEAAIDKKLKDQFSHFSSLLEENFNTHVFATATPKKDIVDLLKDENADLVICLTPEKKVIENFFHSSFTNYMNAHAPCDVLALRI
jgi:nucleotide-binding universal stress UspA family protein